MRTKSETVISSLLTYYGYATTYNYWRNTLKIVLLSTIKNWVEKIDYLSGINTGINDETDKFYPGTAGKICYTLIFDEITIKMYLEYLAK